MVLAAFPVNEAERLVAVSGLNLPHPDTDAVFEAATENVLRVCKTPFAQVGFMGAERQWRKAGLGGMPPEVAREASPCAHTVSGQGLLVVEDMLADPRMAGNPYVTGQPHLRFYAGAPVKAGPALANVGSLCVLDTVPRQLTPHQLNYLQSTAVVLSAALVARSHPELLARLMGSCHYSALLVSAQAGYRVLASNAEFERVYGMAPADIHGRPLSYFLGLDDLQPGVAIINRGLEAGKPCQARLRCLKADGHTVSSVVLLYPLQGDTGPAAYFALLLLPTFVHGYEKFFLSLGEQDREFMMSLHVDGFWTLDAQLRLSDVSNFPRKASEGELQLPQVGQLFWQAVSDFDMHKSDWRQLEADMLARRSVRDFHCCRNTSSGELWLSISGYPCYSVDRQFTGYRGTVRNITEQVRSQQVQTQQQLLLKTCLDNLQPGVLVLYREAVVYCNTSALRMLGYADEAALHGVPLAHWIAAEDLAFAQQRLMQMYGESVSVPPIWLKLKTRTGEAVQATVSLSSIVWSGQPHLLCTLTRISEGAMMEVEIRATQERYERLLVAESETHQTHIARELHDSLGSHLAGISMMLADIKVRHGADPALVSDLARTLTQVQTASEVTRGLARGLMPVDSTPGSFWRALERLCLDTQHIKDLDCEFDMEGDFDQVPPLVANHLFRIAQEAITNALRHGHANLIRVLLKEKQGYCLMTVEDNGDGFVGSADHNQANPGMGLRSMHARSKMIRGYLRFSTSQWGGACINVFWPNEQDGDDGNSNSMPVELV
ncbi:MAG: PAS domain S-box protein [Burkholderiaceae bacterium]